MAAGLGVDVGDIPLNMRNPASLLVEYPLLHTGLTFSDPMPVPTDFAAGANADRSLAFGRLALHPVLEAGAVAHPPLLKGLGLPENVAQLFAHG